MSAASKCAVWEVQSVKEPIVIQASRMTFSIVNSDPDTARVAIFGQLEVGMIGVFRRELSTLLRLRPACVEVDMSRLRFIDGAGVDLLLSFFKDLSVQGGQFVLFGLCDQPLESFKKILVDAVLVTPDPTN